MTDITLQTLRYIKQLCIPGVEQPVNLTKDLVYLRCYDNTGRYAFAFVLPHATEQRAHQHFRMWREDPEYNPTNIELAMLLLDALDGFEVVRYTDTIDRCTLYFTLREEHPQHLGTDAAQSSLVASA